MRKVLTGIFVIMLITGCSTSKSEFISDNLNFAETQMKGMLVEATNEYLYPRTRAKDGTLKQTNMYDWTSGFFAGNLWYLYEFTDDNFWKEQATRWTVSLEPLQYYTEHHDLGFMMYCSYGNAYRLTGKKEYRDILIRSAESLCSRFNETTGTIQSWNSRKSWDGVTQWDFPVIIDNMMNLELLFFASRESGNDYYRQVAIKHTETTLKNHFRPDFSTCHVVNYDTLTGKPLNYQTMQGYADNSTWARGQAWAIYGFTMVYRETLDKRYLDAAVRAADFFLNHPELPSDLIPYWDFNIHQKEYTPPTTLNSYQNLEYRDASAAAITASALFELSRYVDGKETYYFTKAEQMLQSLSAGYRGKVGNNNHFILKHSVGSYPHNEEIDVPLVYADYYYLEALLRYKKASAGLF